MEESKEEVAVVRECAKKPVNIKLNFDENTMTMEEAIKVLGQYRNDKDFDLLLPEKILDLFNDKETDNNVRLYE